jgi:hypothetical protein
MKKVRRLGVKLFKFGDTLLFSNMGESYYILLETFPLHDLTISSSFLRAQLQIMNVTPIALIIQIIQLVIFIQ